MVILCRKMSSSCCKNDDVSMNGLNFTFRKYSYYIRGGTCTSGLLYLLWILLGKCVDLHLNEWTQLLLWSLKKCLVSRVFEMRTSCLHIFFVRGETTFWHQFLSECFFMFSLKKILFHVRENTWNMKNGRPSIIQLLCSLFPIVLLVVLFLFLKRLKEKPSQAEQAWSCFIWSLLHCVT